MKSTKRTGVRRTRTQVLHGTCSLFAPVRCSRGADRFGAVPFPPRSRYAARRRAHPVAPDNGEPRSANHPRRDPRPPPRSGDQHGCCSPSAIGRDRAGEVLAGSDGMSVNGSTARGSMSGAERTVEERVRSMTYIAEWHLERAEQAELEGHERDCRRHQQMAKQAYRVVDMLKKERQASTASV